MGSKSGLDGTLDVTPTAISPSGAGYPGFEPAKRLRDNVGKLEVSEAQNLFAADFEYGLQPMRWEVYTAGGGYVQAVSAQGGVLMGVTSAAGDLAIRQTRPYIRYQPGKTLYMASGFSFGAAVSGQRQRVGFFDDANGVFFEQADPTTANATGMYAVYRSDVGGLPTDARVPLTAWTDPYGMARKVNWTTSIEMIYVEYSWYGAGTLTWGVMIDREPWPLHTQPVGNGVNPITGAAQTVPWCRTGNLPVRYELRNVQASTAGTMYHYGVSVLAKGRIDSQRGFTYGYGMAAGTPAVAIGTNATRKPLLSIRYRTMGTLEYGVDSAYSGSNGGLPAGGAAITGVSQSATGTTVTCSSATWTAGQWVGKYLFARGATAAITSVAASAGSAVITTTANPNYMTVGMRVTISGATGNTSINGTFPVTAASAGTFTITGSAITTGSVTGTPVYTSGQGGIGRIVANTATTLTVVDNVLSSAYVTGAGQAGTYYVPMTIPPAVGGNYIIGLIDRGEILPQQLQIYASANCTLELVTSTALSPVALTGASFATMYSLGSVNSFAERDVSGSALSGGEVVYNAPLPSGGLQTFDLSAFFPLYTNIQGNAADILTVAITTGGTGASVGASVIGQEAMS